MCLYRDIWICNYTRKSKWLHVPTAKLCCPAHPQDQAPGNSTVYSVHCRHEGSAREVIALQVYHKTSIGESTARFEQLLNFYSVYSQQEALLEDLRTDIPVNFNFLFSDSHVEVISGKQEGKTDLTNIEIIATELRSFRRLCRRFQARSID